MWLVATASRREGSIKQKGLEKKTKQVNKLKSDLIDFPENLFIDHSVLNFFL